MNIIKITDSNLNKSNIVYLYSVLGSYISDAKGRIDAAIDSGRAVLNLNVGNFQDETLRSEIEDKVADVIAVSYKYDFFKKRLKTYGLNNLETELLYSAVISADLEEDKRFVIRKIKNSKEYSIDGVYNFRLGALKNKWDEIAGYIPDYFAADQLREFITYLIKEKKGRRVYVENGKVYDGRFKRLMRTELLKSDSDEGKIIKEVILSGCGEVELSSKIDETDEFYLKEYFGDNIFLRSGYFS